VNNSIRKALLLDAFYQVLDNKIFRFLIFLILAVVLTSFVIGFREDRIVVFFGWSELRYDQFFSFFGQAPGQNFQVAAIHMIQKVIVSVLAGLLGMIFCISATSFFIPRMLERGSADIAFSKPLSRLRLLLARYFSGVLFVTLLASFLIGGIYLGVLVGSGYNDPGFLWSAVTLVYLFAILHAVSTMIGVLTRSTVASILVTIMFFWFNGCIQQNWILYEYVQQKEIAEVLRGVEDLPPGIVPELPDEEGGEDDSEEKESSEFIKALVRTLKLLHYTGPKTTDASYISSKLLAVLRVDVLTDEEGRLTIEEIPSGYSFAESTRTEVDLDEQPVTWALERNGEERGRVELRRRPRAWPALDGRRVSSRRAAKAFIAELDSARIDGETSEGTGAVDRTLAIFVEWTEGAPEGPRVHQAAFFTFGDWLYQLEAAFDPELVEDEDPGHQLRAFVSGFKLARDEEFLGQDEWYERRLGWTSELKFNLFFSIGSSVAFAVLMLLIAWWRLSRIDF